MDVVRLMLFFLSLYEERAVNKRYDDPVYIILIGWDKAVGFGIDRDYDTVQAFQAMLQKCGELNMHFIFIVSDTRSVPQNITVACKYTCCTQCSDDASSTLLGSGRRASKADPNMKNGYIYLRRGEGTAITRCKLYRSKKERKVKADEFVLGG